jgi:hypothetical protein
MAVLPTLLYRPLLHGAVGMLDELLTALPVISGLTLLYYLYAVRRQIRRKRDAGRPANHDSSDAHP